MQMHGQDGMAKERHQTASLRPTNKFATALLMDDIFKSLSCYTVFDKERKQTLAEQSREIAIGYVGAMWERSKPNSHKERKVAACQFKV